MLSGHVMHIKYLFGICSALITSNRMFYIKWYVIKSLILISFMHVTISNIFNFFISFFIRFLIKLRCLWWCKVYVQAIQLPIEQFDDEENNNCQIEVMIITRRSFYDNHKISSCLNWIFFSLLTAVSHLWKWLRKIMHAILKQFERWKFLLFVMREQPEL